MAPNPRGKVDYLVWSDDEVELLLRMTLKYKTSKLRENVDWETCQSKYVDITSLFRQQYNTGDTAAGKDFPHDPSSISQAQITAKLKGIRNKYRHAVDSGRRSGHGRVVLVFYNLCREIWGGPPAVDELPPGIEILVEDAVSSDPESPQISIKKSDSPVPSVDSAAEIDRQGTLFRGNRDDRADWLKRKAPPEGAVQEDLKIKRRMLRLMEDADRHSSENLRRMTTNIELITDTIKNGFDMLQTLFLQQQQQASVPYMQAHHGASPNPHTPRPADALTQLHVTPSDTQSRATPSFHLHVHSCLCDTKTSHQTHIHRSNDS